MLVKKEQSTKGKPSSISSKTSSGKDSEKDSKRSKPKLTKFEKEKLKLLKREEDRKDRQQVIDAITAAPTKELALGTIFTFMLKEAGETKTLVLNDVLIGYAFGFLIPSMFNSETGAVAAIAALVAVGITFDPLQFGEFKDLLQEGIQIKKDALEKSQSKLVISAGPD